jgi:WD40 repeat protein
VLSGTNQPLGITAKSSGIGLQGMGGIGKTVLATALARDKEVRLVFPDGVIWITFGQTPQILGWQSFVAHALGDSQAAFTDINLGKARLKELFAEKACLLILDDIWNLEHAKPFHVVGERCQILVTTRNAEIITDLGAVRHEVSILTEGQALSLLAQSAQQPLEALPATAKEVARECGYLPLALAMVGAMVQGKPLNRWDNLLHKLRSADLEKIRQDFPEYPYPDLFKAMQVSVEDLEADIKERYFDFAVFSEDTPLPEVVLQTFWEPLGLDEYDTQDVIDELVEKSLAQRDENGYLRLHDLQFDYVRKQIPPISLTKGSTTDSTPLLRWSPQAGGSALSALHIRLLNAYQQKYADGWHTLTNDGYIFQQLAHHLFAAGRTTELENLLFDFRWLQVKLEHININALITDYDFLPDNKNLQLVQGALRLSAHILAEDKSLLPEQLLGRLLCFETSEIQALLEQAQQNKTTWLRPLTASLTPPGGPLLHTLVGHSDWVRAVAFSPDGNYAISASHDKTLKVWNWQTGQEVRTLEGHSDWVRAVAFSPDGNYAISASHDKTLKVWNWQTGQVVRTLEGHSDWVSAVAFSPDGNYAISASRDQSLKVWNWQTGQVVRTLEGHSDWVSAVAFSPDGNYAISASHDKTLKVWNWQTGQVVRTLEGHSDWVSAVAFSPDGNYAISASRDQSLKVWNWQTGQVVRTLEGHSDWVSAVAFSPDGNYAISASHDKTLKVWNWQTGQVVRTLEGHSDWVSAVAFSPDGNYAISASHDKTLKVWNWQTGQVVRTLGFAEKVRNWQEKD